MTQELCLEYLKAHPEGGTAREIAKACGLALRTTQIYLAKMKKWRYPIDFKPAPVSGKRCTTYVWYYTGNQN